jgi:CDP-diacylglycerol--glycerol-3-phosphate 3-phosphatidyltransferase
MTKLSQIRQLLSCYLTQPLAKLLARFSFITPNSITGAGFLVTLGAAGLIATRHLFAAGWVVLLAGFLDILDGALARHTGQVSRFGAILDSTVDRLSEAALLFGILIFSLREQLVLEIILVCLALIGSMMVSYLRARAEGLGLECQVGLFTRAERVIVLALGLLLSQLDYALTVALVIITLFSFITASQRFFHVWQQTRNN